MGDFRMTYTALEAALRAEIQKQAPDLVLKYVAEDIEDRLYVAFDFGAGPKGFEIICGNDVGLAAAQAIGMARYWKALHFPPTPVSDITNWAEP